MEKLFKNRKALKPVVASIILIAVTVTVSIAVAAWMGALTFRGTTYKLEITKVEFPIRNIISLTINNIGTRRVEITGVYVNNDWQTITSPQLPFSLDAGSMTVLNITYTWTPQYNHQIKLSTYGDSYVHYYKDAVAPAG